MEVSDCNFRNANVKPNSQVLKTGSLSGGEREKDWGKSTRPVVSNQVAWQSGSLAIG
jgi:hypothetical protein